MPKPTNWDLHAEKDIWKAICAPNRWFDTDGVTTTTHPRSLWYFVSYVWGVTHYLDNHPEHPKWFYEPIHGPYISWLQSHLLEWKSDSRKGGTDRHYIASVIPRYYGKTIIASKSAMIWVQLDEPDMSTLLASSTTSLAEDVYKAIKAVLSGEDSDSWFTWLYGNWKQGSQEWSKNSLKHGYRQSKNISEGSFDVTSVGVGMTGYHHRIHNWDDPIFANNLREGKDAYMRSVHTAVDASYNALQSNGLLMFTLTRYADDDVAGRHFREEGIATWTGMPCPNTVMFDKVEFGKGTWHVYFLQVEDELTGEPSHPILWDRKKIAEAKRRNAEDFACQHQNNPGSGEKAPLTEAQLKDLFIDYKDLNFEIPIEGVSVHIDTAFKTVKTIRTGDDNAIVPWYHDARRNGMIYLDTDRVLASNEWREEDFNKELTKVLIYYRRKGITLKYLTDEVEMGGKAGTYKNRLMSILDASGLRLPPNTFKQINRTGNKRARIRTTLGYWVEGYVGILLHKDEKGQWIIPPPVKKLFNQILRIDIIDHEDVADAASDVFVPGIWRKPLAGAARDNNDDGAFVREPGDEYLKSFSRPLSNEEIYDMIDSRKEMELFGPGRGPDYPDEYENFLPRDPV